MARKRTSPIWAISKKELENIVKTSLTVSEVLKHFGFMNKGRNHKTLSKRLEEDSISIDHFNPILVRNSKLRSYGIKKKIPLKEVLVDDSPYRITSRRKKTLVKEGYLEYKCYIMGCPLPKPEWNSKPLVLILDHINGKSNDNRIENIRFACPNCNSQLLTHCGRNIQKSVKKTKKCGNCQISIGYASTHCKKCSRLFSGQKIVDYPKIKLLLKEVEETSLRAVANKLQCSSASIKQHIKKFFPNWKSNYRNKDT